jgi:hypothetical protein
MDVYGMGDYRVEQLEKRVEKLEKVSGVRSESSGTRAIPEIAEPIEED